VSCLLVGAPQQVGRPAKEDDFDVLSRRLVRGDRGRISGAAANVGVRTSGASHELPSQGSPATRVPENPALNRFRAGFSFFGLNRLAAGA
jgi:hypothetical protein